MLQPLVACAHRGVAARLVRFWLVVSLLLSPSMSGRPVAASAGGWSLGAWLAATFGMLVAARPAAAQTPNAVVVTPADGLRVTLIPHGENCGGDFGLYSIDGQVV